MRLIAVAACCAALGAGAGAIANAGAATGTNAAAGKSAAGHAYRGPWRVALLRRTVHADLVVATRSGFATVTIDRGFVQSVSGRQLTVREGTKTATYKTVTLTIPSNARIRDNGHRASLGDLKAGQRVIVVQGPKRTIVVAHDARG